MYKLLVSDFGKTLIDKEEAIPSSTIVEIDRIRRNGVKFVITTSKNLSSILDYNYSFPFIDYIVSYSGASIYDAVNEKIIYEKKLGINVVKKIAKLFTDYNICYCTDQYNYTQKIIEEFYSDKIDDIDKFIENNKNNIIKIEIHTTKQKISELEEKINANISNINYTINHTGRDYYIDITAKDISLLSSVEKICNQNKIKLAEVFAIGCGEEGYPLISSVGFGAVVKNGASKLKKVSREITYSSEAKGVEMLIKKYF